MASRMKTLDDLLVDELKDLYSAETQLIQALPKMANAATNQDLKTDKKLKKLTKMHVNKQAKKQ